MLDGEKSRKGKPMKGAGFLVRSRVLAQGCLLAPQLALDGELLSAVLLEPQAVPSMAEPKVDRQCKKWLLILVRYLRSLADMPGCEPAKNETRSFLIFTKAKKLPHPGPLLFMPPPEREPILVCLQEFLLANK